MKYGNLLVMFLLTFALCGTAGAQNPADIPETMVYQMDGTEIIAVNDSTFEISKDILIGDKRIIEKFTSKTRNIGSVNTYVIKTKVGTVLVDAGYGFATANTVKNLTKIGITPDKIDHILITHLHGDHIGALLDEGRVVFPNAILHVNRTERAYWMNDAEMAKVEDKSFFTAARQVIAAYENNIMAFKAGDMVLPNIFSIDERGHTPGHVGYLLKTPKNRLLFWGDITHFNRLQMVAPDVAVVFDVDPAQAIKTRKTILKWVAAEKITVAGGHIPFPGIGKIQTPKDGIYVFTSIEKFN